MDFIDFINEILVILNINGVEGILWAVCCLIAIILFKHFYINVDSYKKKENEEINNILVRFNETILFIKKHDNHKLSNEDFYYEILNLLAICSDSLKEDILSFDINNNVRMKELKEKIIGEFEYYKRNQNAICKKNTSSAISFYKFILKNSGLLNIIISTFYTFITLVLLIFSFDFLITLNDESLLNQVVIMIGIFVVILYFILIGLVISLIVYKKFKSNIFNIITLTIVIISPIIIFLWNNIITKAVYSLIIFTYYIIAYPKLKK